MVHHFLRTNPYKMSIFERSVTCSFFRNCTHILTRTQGEKFEDMFLVKIASKGTSSMVYARSKLNNFYKSQGLAKNCSLLHLPQNTKSYDHLQKLTYFCNPVVFIKNFQFLPTSSSNYTTQFPKRISFLSFFKYFSIACEHGKGREREEGREKEKGSL